MERRPKPVDETRLELRRNMALNWIWVLLSHDSHIVNRSEADFETRQACISDAKSNGFAMTGKAASSAA